MLVPRAWWTWLASRWWTWPRLALVDLACFALVDVVRFALAAALAAAGRAGACFSGVRPSEIGLDGAISLGVRLTSDHGIDGLAASCAFVCHATGAQRRGATACETSPCPPCRGDTCAGEEKTFAIFKCCFGIDEPSRPRRCPRPAPTLFDGLDANLGPSCRRSFSCSTSAPPSASRGWAYALRGRHRRHQPATQDRWPILLPLRPSLIDAALAAAMP